jgi:uroporphyrin-III C-methyltransferase
MADETPQMPTHQSPQGAAPAETHGHRRGAGRALALFGVLLALSALAACLYTWREMRALQSQIAGTNAAQQLMQQVPQLERQISELGRALKSNGDAIKTLQARQGELRDRVGVMLQQRQSSNLDWALSEIEELIVIAIHRISLEQDTVTAISAMEAAQARLHGLSAPGLDDVRTQIAADLDALRAVPQVDTAGLSLYLSDLVGRAAGLPLKGEARAGASAPVPDAAPPAARSGWLRTLLRGVWEEFRRLVVITPRADEGVAAFLPEQRYFLYQNLRLQLETARFAVMRHDTDTLRASVDALVAWLKQYFDQGDSDVANVVESLTQMRRLDLSPPLPDLNSSLETLRAYMRARAEVHSGDAPEEETP